MSRAVRPNLFLIGAMKSGTSSLHRYLGDHPDIFMSVEKKEPAYFVDEITFYNTEAEYLELFQQGSNAKFVGESSTAYTKLPTFRDVPERLAEFCPDARLLYLMRDPIKRAVSHYWHHFQAGYKPGMPRESETREMKDAFAHDERYVAYSDYAQQLKPYFENFDRSQIMAITTEELSSDTVGVMNRVYQWLGVDDTIEIESHRKKFHATPETVKRPIWWLTRVRESAAWELTRKVVPKGFRQMAARISEGRTTDRTQVSSAEAIEYIRPILQKKTKTLSVMLEREFPEWKTLWEGRTTSSSLQ